MTKKIFAVLILAGFMQMSSLIKAEANDMAYGYCMVNVGSRGDKVKVVSTVYRVRRNTYHVGIQNSFRDYVDANFAAGADSTPSCGASTETWQEAEDERNRSVGRLRGDGWTVHAVNWAYHGK